MQDAKYLMINLWYRRPVVIGIIGTVSLCLVLYACAGTGGAEVQVWSVPQKKTEISGIGNVSYFSAGAHDGQAVIFVHGTPGDASAWQSYVNQVPGDFNYTALDRPGFGGSDPGQVVPSLDDQAKAVAGLFPAGSKKVILVGHSLGGPIIPRAAVNYPDRVGALVIVAGSLDPALEKINPLQHLGKWWPVSKLLPRSLYNANLEIFALEAELESLKLELTKIEVPVFILHGTKDRLVPYDNVRFMQQMMDLARIEVVTLDGQNHFLPWNSKDTIDAAIVRAATLLNESSTEAPLLD